MYELVSLSRDAWNAMQCIECYSTRGSIVERVRGNISRSPTSADALSDVPLGPALHRVDQ